MFDVVIYLSSLLIGSPLYSYLTVSEAKAVFAQIKEIDPEDEVVQLPPGLSKLKKILPPSASFLRLVCSSPVFFCFFAHPRSKQHCLCSSFLSSAEYATVQLALEAVGTAIRNDVGGDDVVRDAATKTIKGGLLPNLFKPVSTIRLISCLSSIS